MKRDLLLVLIFLLTPVVGVAAERTVTITSAQWAVPHDGTQLLKIPGLATLVHQLDAKPGTRLQIGYPGGDAGTLWAGELKAWLVALGLGSARIEMMPGSARGDAVTLTVLGADGQ